ncbi:hypothetical protein SSCG_00932 [Streptomyces clavuligerus]|nr:hypothetical protein SSCG_00932 [Streptomyces clavuligerus]
MVNGFPGWAFVPAQYETVRDRAGPSRTEPDRAGSGRSVPDRAGSRRRAGRTGPGRRPARGLPGAGVLRRPVTFR